MCTYTCVLGKVVKVEFRDKKPKDSILCRDSMAMAHLASYIVFGPIHGICTFYNL
jgi:hypothetical protein